MKIPEIKKLVNSYNTQQLMEAEECIINEEPVPISIDGEDEGEQLTHILAAIFIKELIESDGLDFKTALREFTSKVRTSIN